MDSRLETRSRRVRREYLIGISAGDDTCQPPRRAEKTPMAIRLSGMTLGGKLSLGYMCVATILLLFGGLSSRWFEMIIGFPLLYAPSICEQAFGEIGRPQPAVRVSLFVLLWVANAYLWGHTIAAIARWLCRRFGAEDRAA
jgi:hypothetical protein